MTLYLTQKKCVACDGGIPAFTPEETAKYAPEVPEWKIATDNASISREFKFKDFKSAMVFANKVGDIAELEGHHPDLTVAWGRVGVHLTTHEIKGLSENDFIVAAKIDQLS